MLQTKRGATNLPPWVSRSSPTVRPGMILIIGGDVPLRATAVVVIGHRKSHRSEASDLLLPWVSEPLPMICLVGRFSVFVYDLDRMRVSSQDCALWVTAFRRRL